MKKKTEIRYLSEIKGVLYDSAWAKKSPNLELYYMQRGAKTRKGLRYDITVIPPRMLGKEFVKTKGNRNSGKFLELYTVLEGKAVFLMQKTVKNEVMDVFAVKTKRGESVVEPSEYDIVSINPSKQTLRMGNWIPNVNKNSYDVIEKKKGACYFLTKKGWIKNKRYKSVPKIRFEKPLKKLPKSLDFLYGN